jgi:hypothetical protein
MSLEPHAATPTEGHGAASSGDGHERQHAARHEDQDASGGAGHTTVASPAPPPWQRAPGTGEHTQYSAVTYGAKHEAQPETAMYGSTGGYPQQGGSHYGGAAASDMDVPTVMQHESRHPAGGPSTVGFGARTAVNTGGPAARPGVGASPSRVRRPTKGPRRASLQVKRVDPWSVLKLALVLSVAVFFCWMVTVGVLYGVLGGMGVWDKLNNTYNDLAQAGSDPNSGGPLISASRVFGVAAIIGAVNIVLFTALATVGAFVYNVSADLAGGLEVTLSERE